MNLRKIYRLSFLKALAIVASMVMLALFGSQAFAAEMAITMQGEMAPPEGLKSFKAMTFAVDVPPGVVIPLHSHQGRGQVLLLDGEVTIQELGGKETIYHKGDVWIEEVDNVHGGRNSGQTTASLIWTILLPDGAQLEVPYTQ